MHPNIKQTPQNKDATYTLYTSHSNGATVQHIHSIQVIATICPKQQLGILQASKQHATASQHENKRHGHDVQVKHNKT